jgi:small conductance mechanosensitive channel
MLRALLIIGFLLAAPAAARAQAAAAPAPAPAAAASPSLTAAQAQAVLDVLRDDAKRAQIISVLENLAKALPAAPAGGPVVNAPMPSAAVPAAGTAPAPAPPPAVAAPAAALPLPLAPDSLGAEILVGASKRLASLSDELADTAQAVTDFPLFARWIGHLARSPDARADILRTAWKLALLMAAAILSERLVIRLLCGPAARLAERAPDACAPGTGQAHALQIPLTARSGGAQTAAAHPPRLRRSALLLLRRLPFALGLFALDLTPIIATAAVGYALLGTPLGAGETTRLVILAVLNAYLLTRTVVTTTRRIVTAENPRLRLVYISDGSASYILRWVRRIAIIAIFGYAIAEVGLLFGLYRVAHDALIKLVVLAVHVSLVVIVLQTRRHVADWIRARPEATGPMAVLRNRLAAVWHIIAVFYLFALWLVWAFEVPDGFPRLLRLFVSSVAVLAFARFLTVSLGGSLERILSVQPHLAARYPGLETRARRYQPVALAGLNAIVATTALVVLFQAWGLDSFSWFSTGALGGRILSALINIAITLLIGVLGWEVANAAVQRHLARLSRDPQAARSARLRTLLPMFRTALAVSIVLVAGLIVLSEIGVNIAPLLAGAGVVGLAIGFGSQKLVQDIITGLFLLLENAMQVGDVVSLGGLSGSVEALSVRTIRLRADDGSVHIVPFSAVTTVTNMTRDYGFAVMDLTVGLDEDPDRVSAVVCEVAGALRSDPRWASAIRDDLEVLGLNKFVDLGYVLQVRLQTLPGRRWAVARELNQRIKARFDELAIDSPMTSPRALGREPSPALMLKRTLADSS